MQDESVLDRLNNPPVIDGRKKPIDLGDMPEDMDLELAKVAIHEILEVNNDMRQLIYDGASQNEIKKLAINNGMSTLREAGIGKVKTGESTIEEVIRATVEDI